MQDQTAFRTSVCPEYDALLHRCKAFFDECRKSSQEAALNEQEQARKKDIVERLLQQYERSYANLVHHFDHCRICQASQPHRRRVARAFAAHR